MAQLKWYVVEEIKDLKTGRVTKMKVLAGPFPDATQMGAAAMKLQEQFDAAQARGAPYRVVNTITSEEWEAFESRGGSVEY
jgi:hypothetical protein